MTPDRPLAARRHVVGHRSPEVVLIEYVVDAVCGIEERTVGVIHVAPAAPKRDVPHHASADDQAAWCIRWWSNPGQRSAREGSEDQLGGSQSRPSSNHETQGVRISWSVGGKHVSGPLDHSDAEAKGRV